MVPIYHGISLAPYVVTERFLSCSLGALSRHKLAPGKGTVHNILYKKETSYIVTKIKKKVIYKTDYLPHSMLPEWLLEKIITTLEDYIMPCTRSTTGSSTFFTRYKAKGQLMRSLQTVQKELQELQELKRKKGEKISNIKTTTRPSVQYLLLSLFLLLKTRKQTWKKDYKFTIVVKTGKRRAWRLDIYN